MNAKFSLFFLVAVCLAQGFQARIVKHEPFSIGDIIDSIKKVVKEVEQALSKLINELPEILQGIEDKIKEIISSIKIDDIVTAIQDQVDAILKKFGVDPSTVRDCVDNEKEAVQKLVEDSVRELAKCQQAAEDQVEDLKNAIEELKARAHALIEDSAASVKQCVDENGANLPKVIQCLKGHLEEIKADAAALIAQILQTIIVANEKAIQVPLQLTKCVAKVQSDAITKQKEIIDEFTKCVEKHKEEQENNNML